MDALSVTSFVCKLGVVTSVGLVVKSFVLSASVTVVEVEDSSSINPSVLVACDVVVISVGDDVVG